MRARTGTAWRAVLDAWMNVERRHPLAWRAGALGLVAGVGLAALIELGRVPGPPRALGWPLISGLVLLALAVGRRMLWNDAERRPRALWRLAGFMLLAVGLNILAVAIGLPRDPSVLGRGGGADILRVTWGVLAIITVAALIAVRLLDRRPVSQLGIVPGPGYWGDLGFGLALGALLMTVVFGAELWAGWIRIAGFRYSRSASESFAAASLYVALAFVAVAFYEELANRGYLLRTLAQGLAGRRLSPAAALLTASLLSSLLFGLGHAGNPHATFVSTFNIALTGVLLSLPYILTGRLAASIGMHATWNFFQGVVYGFPVSGLATPARLLVIEQGGPPLWTGADFGPEAGLVGLFACVLGGVLIIWRQRRRRGSLALCIGLADGAAMAAGGGSLPAVDVGERPLDDVSSREEGFGQIQ